MTAPFEAPAFVAYATTSVLLVAHLLFLWLYSGYVRTKTKTAPNPEDAKWRGTAVRDLDPPEVARVLRVHANGEASVYPFLFLGLVFVLAGGSAGFARVDFTFFVGARILHSVAYLFGKQPWRTIFYSLSLAALGALLIEIVLLLVQ
jgi:prostaglandin-E synthase 1